MPRLKPVSYDCEDAIYNYILLTSHARHISQKRMGLKVGKSQQALSNSLRNRTLKLSEAIDILSMLDAELEVMQYDQPTRKERKVKDGR